MQTFVAILEVGIPLATALILLWTLGIAVRTAEAQERAYSLSSVFDYVIKEYLNPKQNVIESVRGQVGGLPLTWGDLKRKAANERYANEGAYAMESAVDRPGWQNRLAFQVSVHMEQIGAAVMAGCVPAKLLLPILADQVVEDWMICSSFVRSYRDREKVFHSSGVSYHRRHAEFLALLAALWMNRNFPEYGPLVQITKDYGGPDTMRMQFLRLAACDANIIGAVVRRDIRDLIGIRLPRG